MNKYLLLVLALFMFSCSDDGVNDKIYKYEFFENSDLSINEVDGSYIKYGVILNGDKVVFKYTYVAEDKEQIADDEYAEFIHFEIDSNVNSFDIDGVDLMNAKTILTKSCFCFFPDDEDRNVNPVGTISGEKISNDKWRINFDVTFYGEDNRAFETIFSLK
tara:strand:+ start:61 stop:543 length:483 start_codon:yes stop_codon:yes gene_type:complete